MRWLVTGAGGFTGRHLVARLRADGREVIGLGEPGGADADLLDPQAMRDALRAASPDVVVHLAATSFVAHDDPSAFGRVNVGGTRNLLAAAAGLSTPPRVILASSAAVYGRHDGCAGEDLTPAPVNDYGRSKLEMERMAAGWGDRIPIVITRPFNYTGPGQNTKFLVPKLVSAFARREPAIRLGNTKVSRDFSDIRDVVEDYLGLAAADCVGATLNLCAGKPLAVESLVAMLQEITGHRPELVVDPALFRPDEIISLWGSDARLRATLGRGHSVPIEDTLRSLLDFHGADS